MNELKHLQSTCKILDEFVKQAHIAQTLAKIDIHKIKGWEKWWHIEFAMFLETHEKVENWQMEIEFEVDHRKNPDGTIVRIDFCYQKQGWGNEFIFIELKQNNVFKTCLTNMLKDTDKMNSTKTRSVIGFEKKMLLSIGIFKRESSTKMSEIIENKMFESGYDPRDNPFILKDIPNTEWMYLIF